MKFIEAQKIMAAFQGGAPLDFVLAMSGQAEPLEPFLAAAAAERGFEARIRTLPFNTLGQALHTPPAPGDIEVFLLLPWDLVPEADWRSGFPETPRTIDELIDDARRVVGLVRSRDRPPLFYVDAPVPEVLPDHNRAAAFAHYLRAVALEFGARLLPGGLVSMENLIRSGSPFASSGLGVLAREVVAAAVDPRPASRKVLVTDFDNTLWRGVVGEDGIQGLEFGPNGLGFPHFIYQTFLKRLKATGVLLAGVTKNDPDLARAPLQAPQSVLAPDDFVSILASYNPKSAQIRELAGRLNLGLDAFVFVDDNPVELAEVAAALPDVRLVEFPSGIAGLPRLVSLLSEAFHSEGVTTEDRERTELYRRRLAGLVPADVDGADLRGFLSGLEMRLKIVDRTTGDRDRAVQLINKTNQFNLNGIRRSDTELAEILAAGGRLYTASLSDRHGSHGEILSCLMDSEQVIRSLVLSCRVFQRRVEMAFLVWLASQLGPEVRLEFRETERNEPFQRFLRDPAFRVVGESVFLDIAGFSRNHRNDLELFHFESP